MNLYFQTKRAKDEMKCLNVEILRLLTNLYDDHVDFNHAIRREQDINPYLAHELAKRWQYQQQISERIVGRLIQTSHLDGFTGQLRLGRRVGRDPGLYTNVPIPYWAEGLGLGQCGDDAECGPRRATSPDGGEHGGEVDEENRPAMPTDDSEREALDLVDFMDNLAV